MYWRRTGNSSSAGEMLNQNTYDFLMPIYLYAGGKVIMIPGSFFNNFDNSNISLLLYHAIQCQYLNSKTYVGTKIMQSLKAITLVFLKLSSIPIISTFYSLYRGNDLLI